MVEALPVETERGALPEASPLQSSTYCASHEFYISSGGILQSQSALKTQTEYACMFVAVPCLVEDLVQVWLPMPGRNTSRRIHGLIGPLPEVICVSLFGHLFGALTPRPFCDTENNVIDGRDKGVYHLCHVI